MQKKKKKKVLHSDRLKQKAQITRCHAWTGEIMTHKWYYKINQGYRNISTQRARNTLIKPKSSYIKSLEASLFHEKQQTPSQHCIKLIFGMEERVKKNQALMMKYCPLTKQKI